MMKRKEKKEQKKEKKRKNKKKKRKEKKRKALIIHACLGYRGKVDSEGTWASVEERGRAMLGPIFRVTSPMVILPGKLG